MLDKCTICNEPIQDKDRAFSTDQELHPGVLGHVHQFCYSAQVDQEPALPWTDPLSGEIDFKEMGQDLGADAGDEDDYLSEEENY